VRTFETNTKLYGKKLENRDIVMKGVLVPLAALKLIGKLTQYSGLGEPGNR